MRRSSRLAMLASMAVSAGLAAGADGAAAGGARSAPAGAPVTQTERIADSSALSCHVELPVRLRGASFESRSRGATASCTGLLLGQPITSAVLPSATGEARGMHHMPQLPPVFGTTKLQLKAVSAALPLQPPDYTRVKLALVPVGAGAPGVRSYSGSASVRGREHAAAASLAFEPGNASASHSRRCCSGRLIVDLTLWDIESENTRAAASAASIHPLGTSSAPAPDEGVESALHCHLDMPVQIKGVRFESTGEAVSASCAGLLMGRPIKAAERARVTGRVKILHPSVTGLPAMFGATELRLRAIGLGGSFFSGDTPVRLALTPSLANGPGAGHFTGGARVRGRDHQADATFTFQSPTTGSDSRRCCASGRLIVDLTLSDSQATR